jgi:hypothetical protein
MAKTSVTPKKAAAISKDVAHAIKKLASDFEPFEALKGAI